ncbi:MAG: hypothetical protein PQJ59_14760 [Spirochaetales bacterium]|nr:hypothetical protein [Spirochaetales bacterium]
MSKILVHFPILLSLLAVVGFIYGGMVKTYWLFIPAWQSLCLVGMLSWDGKNRMKRFRRLVALCEKGYSLDSLPREATICGFFIRSAVRYETKSARAD